MSTYRTEFARIGHETASAAPAVGGRTIRDRLFGVPYLVGIAIGAPVLLFAVLGAAAMALRRTGDRLVLALGGWSLACALFLVLGILTPVDMRYYLASLPAVAIAAGYGAAWAWSDSAPTHRTVWRLTAALFLAGTLSTGFRAWWDALG
jgi:purine-cytosine permease-like protein